MYIEFKQINLTKIDEDIEIIKLFKENNYLIFGVEVTDSRISNYCDINIDPQHSKQDEDQTSLECIFNSKDKILEFINKYGKVLFLTVKPDMDSISSLAMLKMILNEGFHIDSNVVLRLKAIAHSDKQQIESWENRKKIDYFEFPFYTKYGLPISLMTLVGDKNLSIYEKVLNVEKFLKKGEFDYQEHYEKIALNKKKNNSKNTQTHIIEKNKLVFVESSYRGAVGLGYRKAPVVIAKNPHYKFGDEMDNFISTKYTISQYSKGYLNVTGLINELNKNETCSGQWGGSSTTVGSPLHGKTSLTDQTIIEITKKHLKV